VLLGSNLPSHSLHERTSTVLQAAGVPCGCATSTVVKVVHPQVRYPCGSLPCAADSGPASDRELTPPVIRDVGLDGPSHAYPNAYPNRVAFAFVRDDPHTNGTPADLHRRTWADLGGRVSGP
jgi:hypothetical protein